MKWDLFALEVMEGKNWPRVAGPLELDDQYGANAGLLWQSCKSHSKGGNSWQWLLHVEGDQ